MARRLATGVAGIGIVSVVGGAYALYGASPDGVGWGQLSSIIASNEAGEGGQKAKEPTREDRPEWQVSKPAETSASDPAETQESKPAEPPAARPAEPPVKTAAVEVTSVPCGVHELVAALVRANAEGGGTLTLAAGCTYRLSTPDQSDAQSGLPIVQHPITINGAGATITRSANAAAFRFFTVRGGGELNLTDLNLTNGQAASGGSIQIDHDATATAERVTFTRNAAFAADGGGGAIFNDGHLTVVDSAFHGNRATNAAGNGGALLNGGVLTVAGSEFTNNSAGGAGGGFANYKGAADVATSTFVSNIATEGGGIASVNARTKVWDTDVTRNSAKVGGGIVNREAVITLRNLGIRRNISTTNGGGLATVNGLVSADDSFVEENSGGGNGAGIFAETSTLLVRRTEVNRNSGVGQKSKGAGIHAEKGQVTVFKSRVAENDATEKPGGLWVKDARANIDHVTTVTRNQPVNCGTSIENCFG